MFITLTLKDTKEAYKVNLDHIVYYTGGAQGSFVGLSCSVIEVEETPEAIDSFLNQGFYFIQSGVDTSV